MTYVYTRPAEYRAVARLQISPAGIVAEGNDARAPALQGDPKSFLTEVQVLTSRPLLEEVVKRIKNEGKLPSLGQDPVDAVQRMLRAEPVEGTQVVQLSAEGSQQALVSELVNTVAEAYRQHVADSFQDSAASTNADVSDEAQALRKQVLAKQHAVEVLRERYDIVSLDRKENEVLAKIEGLNRSYAETNEQVAKAQGRLQALRSAVAAGKPIARAQDGPALATIEQSISTLREQARALERRYSPALLALDPDTKTLPSRIAELEQRFKDQQAASGQAAVADAEDELSGAETTVSRLRKDLDDNQKGAREFAARLSEFKVMQDDLDHLQAMERAVLDRSTKLQSSVRERAPRVQIVEAAAPSFAPWRPDYTLNALISLAGSIVFGLFATWLADFLGGPAPERATMVHHSLALPSMGRYSAPPLRTINTPSQVQLPAPDPASRELDDPEIAGLIANSSDDLCLVVVALLMGLSPAEIVTLSWDQIDFACPSINVGGAFARTIRLEEPLTTVLRQRHRSTPEAAAMILRNDRAESLTVEDLNRLVLYGAYDAGLDHPQEVTSATLRHTYLAFLLQQGIRAADISRIAGHIPQDEMVAYMQLALPRARLPLEQIDCIHPALRRLASSANT